MYLLSRNLPHLHSLLITLFRYIITQLNLTLVIKRQVKKYSIIDYPRKCFSIRILCVSGRKELAHIISEKCGINSSFVCIFI
jgi:hypothetical protein